MQGLHLLVCEGNTASARARMRATMGATPGEDYARALTELAPGMRIDLCTPADAEARLPEPLDSYHGVVITGSALNIYHGEPESLRQIELVREIFRQGLAVFGSCWGLQLGTVAAGGEVARNPRGRELGIARTITLTEAGRGHPMHAGRPIAFDALAVHSDEVVGLPRDAIVTATNAMSSVQAAEIQVGRSRFWGVQFHPEFSLKDIAGIVSNIGETVVDEGFFASRSDLDHYVEDLRTLDGDAGRHDIAWRLGIARDVLDGESRRREIANWLATLAPANSL